MGFTHIQGIYGTTSGVATTASAVLSAAPTVGNLVCVGLQFDVLISSLTVKDSNNNSYTVTANSPSPAVGTRSTYLAYRLVAPANASATITATWTTNSDCQMWAEEFHETNGQQHFDSDNDATGSGSATISTPALTVAAGELLFSVAIPASPNNITAPAAGGTLGIWTGAAGGIHFGVQSEYVLSSASGSQAVQYTMDGVASWTAMIMAFNIVAPTTGLPVQSEPDFMWRGGDWR